MKTKNQIRKAGGFSLSELLVVIAIIGILAAILLPTIGKIKMRAKRTVCLSNLKQMGQGYFDYATSHTHTLPYDSASGNTAWLGYLKKEHGMTDQTLHCPLCSHSSNGRVGDMRTAWRAGKNNPAADKKAGSLKKGRKVKLPKDTPITAVSGLSVGKKGDGLWELRALKGRRHSHTWHPRNLDGFTGAKRHGRVKFIHRNGTSLRNPSPRGPNYYFFTTRVVSKIDQKVGLLLGGNDGHSLFVDGKYVTGGGFGVNVHPVLVMKAGKSRVLTIVLHNSGGDYGIGLHAISQEITGAKPVTQMAGGGHGTSTYSINAWAQSNHPQENVNQHKFYEVLSQATPNTPVFMDGIWADVMPNSNDPAPPNLNGQLGGMSQVCIDRHEGMVNVAFMDGSTRSVKLAELWSLKWHRQWQTPAQPRQLPAH